MPQHQLNPRWTKEIPTEQIEEVEKRLISNKDLFLLLDKILEQKLEANNRERRNKKNYALAAWAEYQADSLGYERALTEVRSYLQIVKEE